MQMICAKTRHFMAQLKFFEKSSNSRLLSSKKENTSHSISIFRILTIIGKISVLSIFSHILLVE